MSLRPRRPGPLLLLACSLAGGTTPAAAQADQGSFPTRVLITNDNGIDDPKLVALARAFSRRAETWVVAPSRDRSGTGTYLALNETGALSVERRDLGPGIRALAVDGYPADCVVLALLGPMRDAPPDLVVSGVNGGANLGADWMFSGTIGAARVAALAGVPAMAVSGLDDDIPGAVAAVVEWVVRLAGADLIRDLGPGGYLTVSLPRIPPGDIRGVRLADRAPLQVVPRLEAGGTGTWRVTGSDSTGSPVPTDSDEAASDRGYIVLVPMRADEVDHDRLTRWQRSRVGERIGVPMQPWP